MWSIYLRAQRLFQLPMLFPVAIPPLLGGTIQRKLFRQEAHRQTYHRSESLAIPRLAIQD
ncbi:hypothetical protein BOTBODRAFT_243346 [Botryobasidium botryosum FD-172 SS1]|uniref:Uncharacterized protein n=1 Tax=Botryobasidium botryosum (strain FD-172 SS1) TaxID=930990 RepID=A0A067M572_BOTB1|nr:hypothetical protein BOTBODRAFT_243346 [Botryobasidium botryosum FD-172 SS1]